MNTRLGKIQVFIASLLATMCTVACTANRNAEIAPAPKPRFVVAVMGDSTRIDLLQEIASRFKQTVSHQSGHYVAEIPTADKTLVFRTINGDKADVNADMAANADYVLLACDATQGPQPIHREHIILCREMSVPHTDLALTKSDGITDKELLELEELELRETLNHYGLPGDDVNCFLDSEKAMDVSPDVPRGPQKMTERVALFVTPRKPWTEPAQEGLDATIYALVPEEAFKPMIAKGVSAEKTTIAINGNMVPANLTGKPIKPGATGDAHVTVSKPVAAPKGQRFALIRDDHVYAVGTCK